MFILQITAKATIDLVVWIPVIAAILVIIVNILSIKKMKTESNEKFATKEYVTQEIEVMDEKIKSVKDDFKSTKDDIKYIRGRIDSFIDSQAKRKN